MMWAVNAEVTQLNSTHILSDVKRFMSEAIGTVISNDWISCVHHAEQLQEGTQAKLHKASPSI
jgi:hypothetical protein